MRRIVLAGVALAAVGVLVLVAALTRGPRGAGEADAEAAVADLPDRRIRVEVLNAAGIARLAQRGTDLLRDRGFDVVYYGNARGFNGDTSVVLDRVGDPEAAAAVARAIGIERVRSEPDTGLYLEATVVLGRDWEGVDHAETRGTRR